MLPHEIVRLQVAPVVTGPEIGVSEAALGKSPQDRFHYLLPPDRIPANTPLVLLWCGDQLSSPDTIAIKGADKNGPKIDVNIELRRFEGALHANVVTVPIAEVDLGALEAGLYEVSIAVTELRFRKYGFPENATNGSTSHMSFSFVVA